MNHNLRIFGLAGSRQFATEIASNLDAVLSPHTEKYFSDGESLLKSDVNVRGCDVYVVQSLATSPEEAIGQKFTNLLFFAGSLVDASVSTINLVIPYLGFARQDRKTGSREPVTTKYVAKLLEAVSVRHLLTMDIHNLSALQNSFSIPTDNLEAKLLLVDHVVKNYKENKKLAVLAPDAGGAVRAESFRNSLAKRLDVPIDLVHHDKRHVGDVIRGGSIIGDVKDKNVIIYDDMISSFRTMRYAAEAVYENGGQVWAAYATHGLFVSDANEHIIASRIPRIIITDTLSPFRLNNETKKLVTTVSVSKLFSRAIKRIHDGTGSLSELMEDKHG